MVKKKVKKKRPRNGQAITALKREQMFKVFVIEKHLPSVMRQCSVSKPTAVKYKRRDKWDERLAKIQLKAAERADNTEAKRLGENLILVRYVKKKLMEDIKEGGVESKSKVIDLDRVIRLEEFLSGSPDSRPETKVIVEHVKSTKRERQDASNSTSK